MSTRDVPLSSEEFFSIFMTFRSPHHYLATTFPLSHYLQLAVFIAAVAVLTVGRTVISAYRHFQAEEELEPAA